MNSTHLFGPALLVLLVSLCLGADEVIRFTDENLNEAYPVTMNAFSIVNYGIPMNGNLNFFVDGEGYQIYMYDYPESQMSSEINIHKMPPLYEYLYDERSKPPSQLWFSFTTEGHLYGGKGAVIGEHVLFTRTQPSLVQNITIKQVQKNGAVSTWFDIAESKSDTTSPSRGL
ncbi:hypothetical protein CAPTEDRAFT_189010 [Capitella teleta]|uniref:Uncharacterized protein n=1 Tax=Capitella teleta TaxID=283909 RepID=R7UM09_CAPTE|nr:hypothetical protein CAPTEDRAFT_189010 [Capitella teleta]|eukprot:ELU07113.1 hypothetical protein CAPTEDRAFT_189010 [Capitella teleta]